MDEQNVNVESSLLEDLERMSAERDIPTAVEEDEIVTTEVFDEDKDEGRPMFQNKKANIAIGIACAVIVIAIIAACIYAFVL